MSTSPIAEGIEAMTISSEYGAGDRAGEIYQRLLRERIVFLGTQVDQTSANLICAQLLLLEQKIGNGTSRSTSIHQAAR